jgi:Domain of unknown function (DUF4258)
MKKRRSQNSPDREAVVVRIDIRGMTEVVFSPHALDRLKQRGIKPEDVLQALKTPTRRNLPANPPNQRLAWQKSFRSEIHVVYYERKTKIIIVTAYLQG